MRQYKKKPTVLLMGLVFLLCSLSFQVPVFAEGTQRDSEETELFDNEQEAPQEEISFEATYEEFLEYGASHEGELADPVHMWNTPEADISVQGGSPTWKTVNGVKTFVDGNGDTYASPALKVLDVSSWQGKIDWQAVKNSDVDAVILRAGYGIGNIDDTFAYNVQQVKKYDIPYGIYLYSYAYNASFASREAAWTAEIIEKYNCYDMSLPVYFDLEKWSPWKENGVTRHPPTKSSDYEKIVEAYTETLASRGISNVHIYTYRSYLQSALNSSDIWEIASWIAEYNPTLAITNKYYTGQYGWQYTSSGSVPGVSGNVDLSAFSDWDFHNVSNLPSVEIPEGTYYLNASKLDSSGITIEGDSISSGAIPVLQAANDGSSQRFVFTLQSDGSYVITNEASGLALDVKSASAYNGAKVQQYEANGSDAQRWFIRDSGAGYYIQSALGNWVLDISSGHTADGTAIRLYSPNGTSAQLFMVASADSEAPKGVSLSIHSKLDANMVLDVKNGSKNNNAAIQLYACNRTDAQLYIFESAGNGIYSLVNVNSGKVVEVSSGQTANGSKVAQYDHNGSLSQHWSLRDLGNGFFALINCKTGKALDISGGKVSSGKQLQIYTANNTPAQAWSFTEQETMRSRIDAFAKEHAGTIAEGVYAIGTVGSERQVIDVEDAARYNGANVQLYSSNGTNAQRWRIEEDPYGYLTITNVNSGKVLDIKNGSTSDGANIQQYSPNGTYAQKWIAVDNGDGSVAIYSALKDAFVIDCKNGSTSNNTNINAYTSNGTNAQKFYLYTAAAPFRSERLIENGTYMIRAESGENLDVPSAKTTDGVQLQVYASNESAAQHFYFEYVSDKGFYSIRSFASGRMIDVDRGDFVPSSPVNQWGEAAGSYLQRYWAIEKAGDNTYYIVSAATGQVLGCSQSGKLITVPKEDERAVRWSFESPIMLWSQDELDQLASSQGMILRNDVYTIASASNALMVVDVKGASRQNCANVQLYSLNGTNAQKWRVEDAGGGYIRIINVGSGKVLDVKSGSVKVGTNVQQYEWNSSRAQLWLPLQQEDGSYTLYSALGNGLVLDVKNGSMNNMANIQIYRCNGTTAQRFLFT